MATRIIYTTIRPSVDVIRYEDTEAAQTNQAFIDNRNVTHQLIEDGVISITQVKVDPLTNINEIYVYDMAAYLSAMNVTDLNDVEIPGVREYNLENGITTTIVTEEIPL